MKKQKIDKTSPEYKAKVAEYNKKYRQDKIAKYGKEYYKQEYNSETKVRYRENHKESMSSYAKKYNNLDKAKEAKRIYRENHKENMSLYHKEYHRSAGMIYTWARQGIIFTIEERDAMLEAQDNKCKLCLRPQSELKRALGVDHDHKTGKIRGILCDACNTGIGNLRDDPYLLEKAVSYLQHDIDNSDDHTLDRVEMERLISVYKNLEVGGRVKSGDCVPQLWRKRGIFITRKQYDALRVAQSDKCKICSIARDQLNKNLAIDHNHKTGRIRGLLCNNCNTSIGLMKESISLLQKAILYLKESDTE